MLKKYPPVEDFPIHASVYEQESVLKFRFRADCTWKMHRKVGFKEMGVKDGLLQLMITKEEYLNEN